MTHAAQGYRFYHERRIREAVDQFQIGLEAREDADEAALERWLSFMMAGEFEWAWRESDRILQCRRESGAVCSHLPEHQRWLWDGTPLAGRSVMVRCFHGLGDTIQFIRFLPRLQAVCREVQILPQPELQELIPPLLGGEAELQIELMEVPHALRLTLNEVVCPVPYLHPPGILFEPSSNFRVGLAWASGAWRPERSAALEHFRFLEDVPHLELVGLQRGPATQHISPGGPIFHEADWGNTSVTQTARIICGLDLVITTDTMVAHLAGALGVPVWTLLHWDADWRWMVDRDDSPWYPTMRLFRQRTPGDWAEVISRVRREVTSLAEQSRDLESILDRSGKLHRRHEDAMLPG